MQCPMKHIVNIFKRTGQTREKFILRTVERWQFHCSSHFDFHAQTLVIFTELFWPEETGQVWLWIYCLYGSRLLSINWMKIAMFLFSIVLLLLPVTSCSNKWNRGHLSRTSTFFISDLARNCFEVSELAWRK